MATGVINGGVGTNPPTTGNGLPTTPTNKWEELMLDIETELGGNLVDVELEERDYDKAFRSAVMRYKQYGANNYQHVYMKVDVTKGQSVIDVPNYLNTVVKIIRPTGAVGMSSEDLFVQKQIDSMFTFNRSGGCGFNFLLYEMMQQKFESIFRYAGLDVDFTHNPFKNTVTVFNKPLTNETWFLECYLDLEDEEYMEVYWIREWMKAECMEILGRAYAKFSSIPAPTGETSLDGRSMISEAQELKRTLTEEANSGLSGSTDYYNISIG